jgi:DNA processing protein
MLTLHLAGGLGPTLTHRAIAALGDAQAVVDASTHQLSSIEGIGSQRAAAIRRGIDEAGGLLENEKQAIAEYGIQLVARGDDDYPQLLDHIHDPPPLLYVRGELRRTDAVSLAVVGARKCSHYGREQADRLSALCADAGLAIVSGGAYGIDAAAHQGAMRGGGRTIAVVGSGLAKPYPDAHRELFDRIADGNGAVISEFSMHTSPKPENFPRRNRIIAGMALGVLVVEAAERSGALITARLAVDEGREVMALPGRVTDITAGGCHRVIREGWATLVTNAADILDALGETGQLLKAAVTQTHEPSLFEQNLSDDQRKIVDALADDPLPLEAIAAKTGLAVGTLQGELTMLEIRGLIRRERGVFMKRGS